MIVIRTGAGAAVAVVILIRTGVGAAVAVVILIRTGVGTPVVRVRVVTVVVVLAASGGGVTVVLWRGVPVCIVPLVPRGLALLLAALCARSDKERHASVLQGMCRVFGIHHTHTRLRCRYAVPQALRPVVVPGRCGGTREGHQVGRCRAGCPRPAPAREFGLDGEALARRTGGGNEQNGGAIQGHPAEAVPQVHRNAPSRQA
ncbi:hypothetical protein ABTX77_41600 [Streptomyces sp. NPDC097704]|uniref:hypothetical protein n=1 Tax=Streptomyces sp. NPDC097704 TaxID=3157101 RepID=UPI003331F005